MPGDRWIAALIACLTWGCSGPSIDVPSRSEPSWELELEPATDTGAAALSFRARVARAPVSGAPWLIRGALSVYHERALRRGEVSQALLDRAVPIRYWRDGADCLAQPLVWLEDGVRYTLAWSGVGTLRVLEARAGAAPLATMLFPAAGRAKQGLSVVCDLPEAGFAPPPLEPGGVVLRSVPELEGRPRAGCVTFVTSSAVEQLAVSPPLVGGALLDPAPWLPAPNERAMPLAMGRGCNGRRLGDACLEVEDDRVLITPESDDELWLLQQPAAAVRASPRGERRRLLGELAPETAFQLRASVLSARGRIEEVSAVLTTGAARRHLVLNEVLANPRGPEEGSEWIELFNDSAAPAQLGGLWLVDGGGRVPLPDVELGAGELALLVGSAFRPSSSDVALPEAIRLVRLPSLGTRGLANGGEGLLLVGPEGTLSRFPQLAAKTPGRSVARRDPDAADDDPAAFAEHGEPGASPGGENTF